jgi:hypothetical protein
MGQTRTKPFADIALFAEKAGKQPLTDIHVSRSTRGQALSAASETDYYDKCSRLTDYSAALSAVYRLPALKPPDTNLRLLARSKTF